MFVGKRIVAALAVGALSLAGAADAGTRGGLMTDRDLLSKTVTIREEVLRVTPATVIQDVYGNPVTLADLPDPDAAEAWFYEYEAVAGGPGGRVLLLLRGRPVPR